MQYTLPNTLPTTPGALLGHRKNGAPIYLIAGGSEPTPEPAPTPEPSDPGPAPEPQPEPAKTAEPEPPAPEPQPEPGTPEPKSVDELPSWAQKLIKDTRTEAATNRTKAKEVQTALDEIKTTQQQQMDGIAKALGLKSDDAPPDPKELMDKLTAAQQETQQRAAEKREADVMLAVYRAAGKHGADADALLDSRAFAAKVNSLDPAAEDFADRLGEAITEAVESSDRYKAAAAPAPAPKPKGPKTSGGEFTGSPGGTKPISEAELAGMSPEEISKAFAEGRLQHLM